MTPTRQSWALGVAEAASTLGIQMATIALPWFVLVTTGSAEQMAIVIAAELIPLAIVGAIAGRLVASAHPVTVMVASDAVRGAVLVAIVVLLELGLLGFPALIALVALGSSLVAPHFSSQRTLLSAIYGEEPEDLTRGLALLQSASRGAILVGPALAGLLIALVGAEYVLLFTACGHAISAFLVGRTYRRCRFTVPVDQRSDLRQVAGLFRGDRVLNRVTLSTVVTEAGCQAMLASVPLIVLTRFEARPSVTGALVAIWGGGTLLGALVAYRTPRVRLGGAFLATLAALPAFWLLAMSTPLLPVLGALLVGGFGTGLRAPILASEALRRTPTDLRSQLTGITMTLGLLLGAAGVVVVGILAEHGGLSLALGLAACLATLGAMVLAPVALASASELVKHPNARKEVTSMRLLAKLAANAQRRDHTITDWGYHSVTM